MAGRSENGEATRTLLRAARYGLLSTAGLEPAGFPYGSFVQLASTSEGEPLFLISPLAQHTRNLEADPRASVFVTSAGDGDPMQLPRAALIGPARPLEGEAAVAAQETFLRVHPDAELYLGLGFKFWALRPQEARYVGGFGAAAWVPGEELLGG
jgi:putative heme iron utilization protein